MCRTTANVSARAALLAAILALPGCGGDTSSDKAGGAKSPSPTVLTMADGNQDTSELEPFAAAVSRLSHGTLRVELKTNWRDGAPDYGTRVIGDVKAGKADVGWSGSRNFDSLGVPSFDALHAPLLVDSYPLERKTLESPLVSEMLEGLKPLGVVGVGILPGPMRKPLGVSRLVRPEDYVGKTVAFQRSEIAERTLRALGARGAETAPGGQIDPYDGVEQPVAAIDGNEYDKIGRYLTANVNLWPRPIVLFMNAKTSAGLTGEQRAALRNAARAALPANLAALQASEKEAAGNLCRRGLAFVTASGTDLAALRRAVQPVYDKLERDSLTKAAIEQIQRMRSGAAAIADAPTRSNPDSPANVKAERTRIDGVYRVHTTAADLRAAGAPEGEIVPQNYGSYEIVLDRGRFMQKAGAHQSLEGTYVVAGDRIALTITRAPAGPGPRNRVGERFDFHWSLYRDQLTLKPVPGKVSPAPLRAQPWRRIGSAP